MEASSQKEANETQSSAPAAAAPDDASIPKHVALWEFIKHGPEVGLSPAQAYLVILIVEHETHAPAVWELARDSGQSPQAVLSNLRSLEERGLLGVLRRDELATCYTVRSLWGRIQRASIGSPESAARWTRVRAREGAVGRAAA
jgi:hypothetical protein